VSKIQGAGRSFGPIRKHRSLDLVERAGCGGQLVLQYPP
jgi:hypothetical protein